MTNEEMAEAWIATGAFKWQPRMRMLDGKRISLTYTPDMIDGEGLEHLVCHNDDEFRTEWLAYRCLPDTEDPITVMLAVQGCCDSDEQFLAEFTNLCGAIAEAKANHGAGPAQFVLALLQSIAERDKTREDS